MKTIYTLLFILITVTFISCINVNADWNNNTVKGSGNLKKEQRNVNAFSKIDVSRGIQVIARQGSASSTIALEADDNILPYIETKIIGSKLIITIKENVNVQTKSPMKVYVTAPEISEFEVSSAARVTGDGVWKANAMEIDLSSAGKVELNLNVGELKIDVSSAADAVLEGDVNKLEAEISSAAKLNASQLAAKIADVEVSSAAKASIQVTEELRYDVSSAASLKYSGEPNIKKAEKDISGKVSKQ